MTRFILILIYTISCFCVSASLRTITVTTTDAHSNPFSKANTIYIIDRDIQLSGEIAIPAGCILDFQGGTLTGGTLTGNATEIRAGQYQIFKGGLKLSGTFSNDSFSAHWFGVNPSSPNNAPAIKYAIDNAQATPVTLANMTYKVTEPIIFDKRWQHLICYGTLQTSLDIPIIVLRHEKPTIKIRRMEYVGTGYAGTGILFSGNVYNGNIEVELFNRLNYAMRFTPKATYPGSEIKFTHVGSQYNKIAWQYIDCMTGIQFEIDDDGKDLNYWVTENQFSGGRIKAKYGINSIVADHMKISVINGNVFNCVGFEGEADQLMKLPISLKHADFNEFHDLRMSEGIQPGTFIKMRRCAYNNFSIKSRVPVSHIDAEDCAKIRINALLTDNELNGYCYGYNLMYIDNSDPLHLTGETIYSISRDMPSQSRYKILNLDRDDKTNGEVSLSFNDLLIEELGMPVMSDFCIINAKDNIRISINLDNSLACIFPQFRLKFSSNDNSRITFTQGNRITEQITQSGTYVISFDKNKQIKTISISSD